MTANEGLLVLQNEAARVVLDPRAGGGVREFSWRGMHILRSAPPTGNDPFTFACFPMVPFANRIACGRFRFAGRGVEIARNWESESHPLHGQGWLEPWRIETHTQSSATLEFEGGGDEWPWRYRAEQRFGLLEDELSIELCLENLSDRPMPAVIGLHPYFPEAARARLQARLPHVWMTDDESLPIDEAQTPSEWVFDPPRNVKDVALDHCFGGWDGRASLEWPERTVRLRARGCTFLQIYTPADRDFFCIEPQTAASGALGREGTGLPVLASGERTRMEAHLEVAVR